MNYGNQELQILLVEDAPGYVELIENHIGQLDGPFRPHQFRITSVEDLEGAEEQLADSSPDVILLDLGLQETQGMETLERMVEVAPETPIVVLTSLDTGEAGIEAIQEGAQDFLNKDELAGDTLAKSLVFANERASGDDEGGDGSGGGKPYLETAEDLLSGPEAEFDEGEGRFDLDVYPPEEELEILLLKNSSGYGTLVEEAIEEAGDPYHTDLFHLTSVSDLQEGRQYLSGGEDEEAEPNEIDLLVLDLGPEEEGLDAMKNGKKLAGERPIVVLVGEDHERGLRAIDEGARDFLSKDSIDEKHLPKTIVQAVEESRLEEEIDRFNRRVLNLAREVCRKAGEDVEGLVEELEEAAEATGSRELNRAVRTAVHLKELTAGSERLLEDLSGQEVSKRKTKDLHLALKKGVRRINDLFDEVDFRVGEVPEFEVVANDNLDEVLRNVLFRAATNDGESSPKVAVRVDESQGFVNVSVETNTPLRGGEGEILGRGEEGLGQEASDLNLFLVDREMEQVQGDLWVEERNGGSKFTLRFKKKPGT